MRPFPAFLLAVPAGVAGLLCLCFGMMNFAADKVLAAQAPAPVRWDYAVVSTDGAVLPINKLAQLGSDGWEMCGDQPTSGAYSGYVYFKRRKP